MSERALRVSPATPGTSAGTAADPTVVYYDGACPLCRREIGFYRRRVEPGAIEWVDVSAVDGSEIAPGLDRERALARFHVRLPDGRLAGGARAFAALWRAVPGWRALGRFAAQPLVAPAFEVAYRGFLLLRPAMQRAVGALEPAAQAGWPRWLARELRSSHAGEAGAVYIYRGVLAVARDPGVRAFAERHLATERGHLERIEALAPPAPRSRLLALWRSAGFLTGAIPALWGPRAVYATIDAVETFVDRHYCAQIDALAGDPRYAELARTLGACRDDEVAHRDEARVLASGARGAMLRAWTWLVGAGSTAGVAVARRL